MKFDIAIMHLCDALCLLDVAFSVCLFQSFSGWILEMQTVSIGRTSTSRELSIDASKRRVKSTSGDQIGSCNRRSLNGMNLGCMQTTLPVI